MEFLIGSKRTATIITWLALLVFCVLIVVGWWYLLEPTLSIKALVGLIALTLTALAALCARQIGQLRADARRNQARPAWYRGWKPYLFLAIISALGTLNAAFVIFESRAILRNDIATVRDSYSTLRDTAHRVLPVKSHVEKVAKIDALLRNLHEEIVNPNGGNYCGVGDSARAIIAEITSYIPAYHILNGSGVIRPCAPNDPKAERVYQSYEQMAHDMVRSDPAFLDANGPSKMSFLATLDSHYELMRTSLGQLEVSASGLGSTDGLDMEALYTARSNYNADRLSFISLGGVDSPGIRPIDMLQTDRVNSYSATANLFLKRMSHPTSWLYVVLAFAVDFAVIYLLAEFNHRYGRPKKEKDPTFRTVEERFHTDPRFIWVHP